MENLESGEFEYITVGEFLMDLKKKFKKGNDKTMKVVELKKIKQRSKAMKEFVQKFRRAVKDSRYKRQPLDIK